VLSGVPFFRDYTVNLRSFLYVFAAVFLFISALSVLSGVPFFRYYTVNLRSFLYVFRGFFLFPLYPCCPAFRFLGTIP
jgi:hypothetical protein